MTIVMISVISLNLFLVFELLKIQDQIIGSSACLASWLQLMIPIIFIKNIIFTS